MFSSKKPKFLFNLTINELLNVPQVSGRCYVEIQIKDGKLMKPPVAKAFHRKVVLEDDESNASTSSGTSSTSATGNVFTTTSSKSVNNFKAVFDYKLSCNLRFPIKRRENLIENKHLLLKVFYVNDGNDKKDNEVTELGRLEVNLSEYLNFTEPQTAKYLLKNSKVNSLLSLTIYLSELPSNFDFHTLLQINESKSISSLATAMRLTQNSISTPPVRSPSPTSPTHFNVPQFESKNVFGGLNDVVESKLSLPALSPAHSNSSEEKEKHNIPYRIAHKVLPHRHTQETPAPVEEGEKPLIMDPIVSRLYSRIMESTWDPELYTLLEYTPDKSISDIFYSSDNPLGLNEGLLEKYISWSKDKELEDESELLELNGLVNERKIRGDLKSWTIST